MKQCLVRLSILIPILSVVTDWAIGQLLDCRVLIGHGISHLTFYRNIKFKNDPLNLTIPLIKLIHKGNKFDVVV